MFLFNSCGDNNNEEDTSVKSALIGVWNTSLESSNWKTICILPHGRMKYHYVSQKELDEKYIYNEKDKLYWRGYDSYNPAPNAYWTYDAKTKVLSMYTDDGYYAYSFNITMNEDFKSFIAINTQGKKYSFIKVE